MVDRTTRPIVPTEHTDEREHRRLLAQRASASMPKDGTEGMAAPLSLMQYDTADLPDATLTPGAVVHVSDDQVPAYSDGADWVPLATGADLTALQAEVDALETDVADLTTAVADLTTALDLKVDLPLPMIYQGCNAGSIDATHMYFNAGTIAHYSGDPIITFTQTLEINLDVDGIVDGTPQLASSITIGGISAWIGGMDTGASPPASGSYLYFYLLTQDSDGAPAVMCSIADTYGGVTVPSGWTMQRKLHFSVVYHTGRGTHWSGIPDFFQDIDNQFTYLTGAGEDANYMVLNAGTSGSFTAFNCAGHLTDNARTALLWVSADSTHATNHGWVAVRVRGTGGAGRYVWCPPTGLGGAEMTLKLDGDQFGEYLSGFVNAYIYLIGYKHDDPS